YAAKTQRSLASDWRCFSRWCAQNGLKAFPASAPVVVAYLDALAERHSLATLKRRRAPLSHVHDALGKANPARRREVRLALRGGARLKGARPAHRRAPLREAEVAQILAVSGGSPRDLRDRALLLVARDTLARRSD